ncbi:MAG: sulfite exporter TauE/SafE family protein [Planctomycetota bacterium]
MTEFTGQAQRTRSVVTRAWTLGLPALGTLIGCLGAVCGIGGGLFATPLLNLGVGLVLTTAIATSLVMVFATALAATVAEALSGESHLVWPLVFALAAGAFLGTRAGYRFVQRLGVGRLVWIFGGFLLFAGVRLILPGSTPIEPTALDLDARSLTTAFVIGLLGGAIAPMLGIGGGIVMVPGLALFVDGLGFEGARACALAAATVGASRSALLYARRGRVQWRYGFLLAGGAVVGAAIGVQLTHFAGAGEFGKRFLGVLVIFVSLRYLIGAWRAQRRRGARQA